MTDRIVCPVQNVGSFDPDECFHCKFFDLNMGKHTTFCCRKQKTRSRKIAFTDIMLSNRLGIPVTVVVEKEGENGKE